ncbi:hypothetical protein [Piscibacillus halophilus]|nr:hypothetical protein [Piscibacillus halophilus]
MRMGMRNVEWLPMIASIGIGVAAYSMMTGRGGQLQSFLPMITNMMGQQNQQGTAGQQAQQKQGQQQNPIGALAQQAQQGQQQKQQQNQQPQIH